jgi:ATP-dependent helicase/nuclease subunit B
VPTIRPLGDAAEDDDPANAFGADALDLPPAYPPAKRRGALAKLVQRWRTVRGEDLLPPGSALAAADELAALIDQAAFAGGVDWTKLSGLSQELAPNLAEHWRLSASFLDIVMNAWPEHLKEQGAIDLQDRRLQAATALAARWRKSPPKRPVVIAGSTGAGAASRVIMQAVLELPKGAIVLPGLDPDLTAAAWESVGNSPSHPQHVLQSTLQALGVAPAAVPAWPDDPETPNERARRRLLNEALAPAQETRGWNDRLKALAKPGSAEDLVKAGLSGLRLIEAEDESEEALVAALLLRETLETGTGTAALVTPEGSLGRRVAAIMERWGVDISPSAGTPLNRTAQGSFLLVLARWAMDPADPVQLLALLKHRVTGLKREGGELRETVSVLERCALRGPRLDATLGALGERLVELGKDRRTRDAPRALPLVRDLAALHASCADVFGGETIDGRQAAEALALLAEAVAETPDETGANRVWSGQAGAMAMQFLEQLRELSGEMGAIDAGLFPDLAEAAAGRMIAAAEGPEHPRIAIWGQLEARLQRRDRMILAGLNEGAWPKLATADAFLNRKLRRDLGLPDPDERIGLSAHDFAQMANAPEVILLRAKRVDDKPAVASRWLWRLRTLSAGGLGGLDAADARLAPNAKHDPLQWAHAIRRVEEVKPIERPQPKPPVEKRKLTPFSPSRATTLTRDPYADFAGRILGLERLRRVGEEIDPALRGSAVHEAIEAYELADAPKPQLEALIVAELVRAGASPELIELEKPLWVRAAKAYLAWAEARAPAVRAVRLEQKATWQLASPVGPIELKATADRIELLSDGTLAIIDFKTGQPKTARQVQAGLEPQLPLEAAIANRVAFGGIGPAATSELIYFQMSTSAAVTKAKNGQPLAFDEPVPNVAEDALTGLTRMIAKYARAEQPYLSKPRVLSVKIYSDFDRLARRAEWTVEEGEE